MLHIYLANQHLIDIVQSFVVLWIQCDTQTLRPNLCAAVFFGVLPFRWIDHWRRVLHLSISILCGTKKKKSKMRCGKHDNWITDWYIAATIFHNKNFNWDFNVCPIKMANLQVLSEKLHDENLLWTSLIGAIISVLSMRRHLVRWHTA